MSLTFGMPENMAMQRPNSRVVATNAKNNVRVPRHRHRVSSHRVIQVPRRFSLAEYSPSPTDNLELLACSGLA
jgi:hypothetical protein